MLAFGRRTVASVALAPVSRRGADVAVRGLPPSRNNQALVGYNPRAAAVGQCAPRDRNQPPYLVDESVTPWCTNVGDAGPIPLGAGIVSVPAAVGAVFGTATYTLLPVEGFTVEDITIFDATGLTLVASIQIGRHQFLEAGPVASEIFQSGKTMCKLARGFNIFPSVGMVFTFQNPSLTATNVSVVATGYPTPCPQGRLSGPAIQ